MDFNPRNFSLSEEMANVELLRNEVAVVKRPPKASLQYMLGLSAEAAANVSLVRQILVYGGAAVFAGSW